MASGQVLTTGRAARLCQVSHRALNNWIREGRVRAYRTPGGHYRIRLLDLEQFLQEHGMPPPEETPPAPAGVTRVLVVDDEEDVVQVMSQMIAHLGGMEVARASNGFSAGLEIARFRPDLVTLDLMMPYVDGFEVCRAIKADPATRETRVLVVTGYTEAGFIEQALQAGADAWLAKPFTRAELQDKVRALLLVVA